MPEQYLSTVPVPVHQMAIFYNTETTWLLLILGDVSRQVTADSLWLLLILGDVPT